MTDTSTEIPCVSATCPTTTIAPPEKAALNGHHDPTSPFVSLSDPPVRPANRLLTPKSREAAVRAAKKEIVEKVREDWTWPPTSSHMQSQLDRTEGNIEWRERESGSECSSPSPVSNADPYRFDSPDSIAQPVLSKKRKRKQNLEEEMQWNCGLRTYVERRDVWAGARIPPSTHFNSPAIFDSPYSTNPDSRNSISYLPTPPPTTTNPSSQNFFSPPPPATTLSPTSIKSPFSSTPTQQTPLLPLAPPILPPSNPIRATINPSTYPSIYDKIIIRGQSPSIPINLADVVNALVAGWKKDGEWPPKSEAVKNGEGGLIGADVSARREAQRLARKSVGRVRRVFGLGRGLDEVAKGEGGGEG